METKHISETKQFMVIPAHDVFVTSDGKEFNIEDNAINHEKYLQIPNKKQGLYGFLRNYDDARWYYITGEDSIDIIAKEQYRHDIHALKRCDLRTQSWNLVCSRQGEDDNEFMVFDPETLKYRLEQERTYLKEIEENIPEEVHD